jgi:hypothetical protein
VFPKALVVHLKRKGQLFNKQEENQGFNEVSCTPKKKVQIFLIKGEEFTCTSKEGISCYIHLIA